MNCIEIPPSCDPAEIARLLERYLPAAEAARRAAEIAQDMAQIGFVLEEDRTVTPAQWQHLGAKPQAEYVLPKTKFDLNGDDPHAAMDGSLLTRGNLLRLSQAVILGRRWLPESWPAAFQRALLGPEHLDALNEIFWLKFWNGLQRVARGPKQSEDAPDADWQLLVRWLDRACVVNLEVKRRTATGRTMISFGTLTSSLAHSREVFPAAVMAARRRSSSPTTYGAHPITRQLRDASRVLDIDLVDVYRLGGLAQQSRDVHNRVRACVRFLERRRQDAIIGKGDDMTSSTKSDLLITGGLLVLSFNPVVAGPRVCTNWPSGRRSLRKTRVSSRCRCQWSCWLFRRSAKGRG